MAFDIPDGAHVAQRYFQMRASDAEAAQRLVSVCFQLFDWDLTGNESIGFANLELYALMDQIARPGAAGIQVDLPVLESKAPTAAPVLGFDGEEATVTVKLRWELDAEAEAERAAAVQAAENEKLRQARAQMLLKERELQAQLAKELAEKQAFLRERFLEQLVVDAELGGDVYSCGAGAYGQHGHGHTNDLRSRPLLVEGAERGVIQQIQAGAAHSLFLPEEHGDGSRVLACGAGTFGQLGVIDCKPPKAGMAFDDAQHNNAMLVREQLVPNAVLAVSDEVGQSFGPEVLLQDPLIFAFSLSNERNSNADVSSSSQAPEQPEGNTEALDTAKELEGLSSGSSLMPFDTQEAALSPQAPEDASSNLTEDKDSDTIVVPFLGPEEDEERQEHEDQEHAEWQSGFIFSRIISCPSPSGQWRARVVQISAGARHSICVTSCGRAFACGEWTNGALGLGPPPPPPPPPLTHMQPVLRFVSALPGRVVAAAAGGFHSVFVLENGQAWSVGTGNVGQLGFWLPPSPERGEHAPAHQQAAPVAASEIAWEVSQVPNLRAISEASAGSLHTLFLDNDGKVWSCGSGKHGRLGLGHQINTAPAQHVAVAGGEKIIGVSAGEMHSLILTASGRALAFGNNKFGQLGVAMEHFNLAALRYFTGGGDIERYYRELDLEDGGGHTRSHSHSRSSSRSRSRSSRSRSRSRNRRRGNERIELDEASGLDAPRTGIRVEADGRSRAKLSYPSNLLVPVEAWLPPDVCLRSVSAGGNHSVFLTDEGDVWTCGCNFNGQLGLTNDAGWDDPTPPPSPLPTLKGVFEVRILAARNLPKMDMFGSCDAFCELLYQGQKFVSSVKKNTYSPAWGETFSFNFHLDDDDEGGADVTAGKDSIGKLMAGGIAGDQGGNDGGQNADAQGGGWSPQEQMNKMRAHVSKIGKSMINSVEDLTGMDLDGDGLVGGKRKTLQIVVKDWDQLMFADEVGRIVLGADEMEALIVQQIHEAHAQERRRAERCSNRSPDLEGEQNEDDRAADAAAAAPGGHLQALHVPAHEMSVVVQDQDGNPVIGNNGKPTEIDFAVHVLCLGDPPPPPPPRALQVTLACARNLPRMDTFGTCDAFFIISWQGQVFQSQVQSNTLDPDWATNNQITFLFPMRQVEAGGGGDMEIKILDMDKLSAPDEVGRVIIPAASLKHLVRRQQSDLTDGTQTGARQAEKKTRRRKAGGQGPEGLDESGDTSVDQGPVSAEDSLLEQLEEEDKRRSGGGVLEVAVNFARHLPKMDTFGTCDAFVELCWRHVRCKTRVQKNSFSPDFNETFSFPYEFPAGDGGLHEFESSELEIKLYDWDMMGDNDQVGTATVPAGMLAVAGRHKLKPVELSPSGQSSTQLPLKDAQGNVVMGNDKQPASVDLAIRLRDPAPLPLEGVVRVSVVRARNLKAMDRGGTSDPYAVVTLGSAPKNTKARTQVVVKDLSPYWNASFDLACPNLHTESLQVAVYDKDLLSDDQIGTVQIELSRFMLNPLPKKESLLVGSAETQWYNIQDASHARRITGEVEIKVELERKPPPSAARSWIVVAAVKEARGLTAKDSSGTSDPYALLVHGKQKHKTKVLYKELNPRWDETFEVQVDTLGLRPSHALLLSVFDRDMIGADDLIGQTSIDLERILASLMLPSCQDPAATATPGLAEANGRDQPAGGSSRHQEWLPLYEDAARTKPAGEVRVEISAIERLQFHAQDAGDLAIGSKASIGRLGHGGFFQLHDEQGHRVEGGMPHKSLPLAPSVVHLQMRLMPEGAPSAADSVLPSPTREEASTANVLTNVPAALAPPAAPLVLNVHVEAARGLAAMDRGGTSDPYCTIQVGNLGRKKTEAGRKGETRVMKKTLSPVWDQEFELEVLAAELEREVLSIQVFDKDLIGADDLIGETTLPLASILSQPLSPAKRAQAYAWHSICNKASKPCGYVKLGLSFQPPQAPDSHGDAKTGSAPEKHDVHEAADQVEARMPAALVPAVAVAADPGPAPERAGTPRDSFSRALTEKLTAAGGATDGGPGSAAIGARGGGGRQRAADLLYKGAPVVGAGQDEYLPRVVAALAGVKIVAIAAGGAHSLFLTSKLARRQRLVARTVLGRIRSQSLQRAWHRWNREVFASTDSHGRTSHASSSFSSTAAGLISRVTVVKAQGLSAVARGSAPNPMAQVHLIDALEGSKTFATGSEAKTAEPQWRFSFVFHHGHHHHHSEEDKVDIVVWHHEKAMLRDAKTFLGHAALPLSHFIPGAGVCGGWHDLGFNAKFADGAKRGLDPSSVGGKIYIELETVDTEEHPDMVLPWAAREELLARQLSADGKRRLRVTLARAEQLLAMDKGGTSDPFARLSFGSQTLESKVVGKTLNPEFNESFTFNWPSEPGALCELSIALFDHDKGLFRSSSEYLGSICLHEQVLAQSRGLHWHTLEFSSKFCNQHYDVTGRVLIEVQVLSTDADPSDAA